MTTACATSATERPRHRVAAALACAAAAALTGPMPVRAAEAPPKVEIDSPAGLQDRFEKVQKLLRKAGDALEDKDMARVSFLLQRGDEEMARFEAGSNVTRYLSALDDARHAADQGTLPAAGTAIRAARTSLPPLGDYTVARSMEVGYRAALQGIEDGSIEAFRAGLQQMDEATLAAPIAARCKDVREAMGRTRKAMGRNDAAGGKKELDAAVTALGRIEYGGILSRARSGFQLASELLRDRALLAARDQTQRGLKELAGAIPIAPETDKESLTQAQEEARTVWRRLSRPEQDDPDRLAAAGERIETLRRAQRS